MMNLFSDAAKATMRDAFSLTGDFLLTEHLLIALAEGNGAAAQALASVGIDKRRLRGLVAVGDGNEFGAVPFSFGAKRAMEHSLQSARDRGETRIGTGDLLVGLLRVQPSGARATLASAGVDVTALDAAVDRLVGSGQQD